MAAMVAEIAKAARTHAWGDASRGWAAHARATRLVDDGRTLQSIHADGAVLAWDETHRNVREVLARGAPLYTAAFIPGTNDYLASREDGWLERWSIGGDAPRWRYWTFLRQKSLTVLPCGVVVLSSPFSGNDAIVSLADGAELASTRNDGSFLAVAPDGRHRASVSVTYEVLRTWHDADGNAEVDVGPPMCRWRLQRSNEDVVAEEPCATTAAAAFSDDGAVFALVDGTRLRVWTVDEWRLRFERTLPQRGTRVVVHGERVDVDLGGDVGWRSFSAAAGEPVSVVGWAHAPVLVPTLSEILDVAPSSEDASILARDYARVWQGVPGCLELEPSTGELPFCISPKGTFVLENAKHERTFALFTRSDGVEQWRTYGHLQAAWFDDDEASVLVALEGGDAVERHSTERGSPSYRSIEGQFTPAFGSRLAIGIGRGVAVAVERSNAEVVRRADGTWFVPPRVLRVIDLPNRPGAVRCKLMEWDREVLVRLGVLAGARVAVSTDGRWTLDWIDRDTVLRVWSLAHEALVATIDLASEDDRPTCAAFAAGGVNVFAIGTARGRVLRYELRLPRSSDGPARATP